MARNLLYFAIMSLIWGLTWAAIKLGLEVLPPLLLAAVRYLLAAVILLAFAVEDVGAAFAEGRTLRTFASALLVNTSTYGLLFWGMQSVPSRLSGLVEPGSYSGASLRPCSSHRRGAAHLAHALAIAIGCAGSWPVLDAAWARLWQRFRPCRDRHRHGLLLYRQLVARPLVGPVKPLASPWSRQPWGALRPWCCR